MMEAWILPAVILGAILAAILLLVLSWLLTVRISGGPIISKHFWCPLKEQYVDVDFVADPVHWDRYHDVLFCTAFEDRSQPTCDRRCLDLPEAKAAPLRSHTVSRRTSR